MQLQSPTIEVNSWYEISFSLALLAEYKGMHWLAWLWAFPLDVDLVYIGSWAEGSSLFILHSGTAEKPCDIASSTCNGKNEQCHGRGPGWPDEYASNKIIAQRQFSLAKTLQNDPGTELKAPIDYMHTYLDMSNLTVEKSKYGPGGKTCPPAMGYSFAAGTTDGEGLMKINLFVGWPSFVQPLQCRH